MEKPTFSVVVESGSCDQTRRYWEEREHCGHNHKNMATAMECRRKLTQYYCQHGHSAGQLCSRCSGIARRDHTSAQWYNARIHNQDRERVDDSGMSEHERQMADWL